jgi:hypothetical protein
VMEERRLARQKAGALGCSATDVRRCSGATPLTAGAVEGDEPCTSSLERDRHCGCDATQRRQRQPAQSGNYQPHVVTSLRSASSCTCIDRRDVCDLSPHPVMFVFVYSSTGRSVCFAV